MVQKITIKRTKKITESTTNQRTLKSAQNKKRSKMKRVPLEQGGVKLASTAYQWIILCNRQDNAFQQKKIEQKF